MPQNILFIFSYQIGGKSENLPDILMDIFGQGIMLAVAGALSTTHQFLSESDKPSAENREKKKSYIKCV